MLFEYHNLMNFHTIKSILNYVPFGVIHTTTHYFHTIKSILNDITGDFIITYDAISILLSLF